MNKSIEVTGNYGVLTVDRADGLVTDYEPNHGDDYKIITRVNLDEWRQRYHAEPCGPIDILDLGYWTDQGHYEPPDESWRNLMAELQAEREIYNRTMAEAIDEARKIALCGPMGRVMPETGSFS